MQATTSSHATLCKHASQLLTIATVLDRKYTSNKGKHVIKTLDRLHGSRDWPFDLQQSNVELTSLPDSEVAAHAAIIGKSFNALATEQEKAILLAGFMDIFYAKETMVPQEKQWLTSFCKIFNLDSNPLIG